MTTPSWALQTALAAHLSADTELIAMLGGTKIYDHVPRGASFPYVTFASARSEDWSTGEATGSSLTLLLNVWSRAPGRRQAIEIAGRIATILHDAPLELPGHRLVLLRSDAVDVARQPDGETFLATVRLRALTEPRP